MPLTKQQASLLRYLDEDQDADILDADRRLCPGLHFCPDWDGMPICEASPEWEACTCPKPEDAAAR